MRNGTIAIVAGGVAAHWWGGLARWPVATLLMLWPSLGGHLVELWFLNWLRPRLGATRRVQVAARLAVWLGGGTLLALGLMVTAMVVAGVRHVPWRYWWLGGVGFIGIELVAQLALRLRGLPNFYDGRG